ncbi:hypothetical protein [Carboxylicivirga caseinilyticus]|uniref:hypothetical protein n=1 Tax=Carboxylicivirga caseinilyticus TaxID=3417572 RepID=UPI003D344F75|nr:hypothetical protein [Marinilabiliaceae bacterium A049]
MKTKLLLTFFAGLLILSSCKKECDPCMTPPAPFYFDIKDAESGENIFTSGIASSDDLELINTSTNESMDFDFIDDEDVNILMINSIGWKTEIISAKLLLDGEEVFTLTVDAERNSGNCCSWTEYNDIEISNADFTIDNIYGTYIVYY